MVCTAEGSKERESSGGTAATLMATGSERSKPLHNFSLPKWGCQRQMRCVKIDSQAGLRSPSPAPAPEPSPPRRASGDERRRSGDAAVPALGIEFHREFRAEKEKFLTDLRAEMDKIKDKYLRRGPESGEAAEQGKEENPAKPWNLRTRRSACKAPIGGINGGKAARVGQSPQRSDGEIGNFYSMPKPPALRRAGEKKRGERTKFFPTLKRKEVEDDFVKMTGRMPPRKPKKRPRVVQKQIDMSFPGLWLTEVTEDIYRVPEIPDNAKR